MCDTCGCGDPEIVPVDVHDKILAGNDRTAAHNREHFRERSVVAVNLMGSPGAGKTAVLEATARRLAGRERLGALAGDLATERDADRLRAAGITAKSITTGSACHLDAEMVHQGLHHFPWRELDYLFIENVGNLVCPAIYDLGQAAKRGGARGHGGRRQATQVPGHVPQGRPRVDHESRSPAVFARRPDRVDCRCARPCDAAAAIHRRLGDDRRWDR